jgi:hypothetical protein
LLTLLLYVSLGRATYWRLIYAREINALETNVGAAVATLLGPIFPIALTLFYYDQRIRREGYDIERMMDVAGMSAAVSVPAENGSLESV